MKARLRNKRPVRAGNYVSVLTGSGASLPFPQKGEGEYEYLYQFIMEE